MSRKIMLKTGLFWMRYKSILLYARVILIYASVFHGLSAVMAGEAGSFQMTISDIGT